MEKLYSDIFCDFEKGLVWKRNKTGKWKGWRCHGNQEWKKDYYEIKINGKIEQLHRIIFSFYYGISLNILGHIDHINQNKKDNRISNLRLATSSENNLNKSIGKTNTSGEKNICFITRDKLWRTRITINGKQTQKYFKTKEEAIEYRNEFYKSHPEILFGNNI